MDEGKKIDPTRQRFADSWLHCLPAVTEAMKKAQQQYLEQRIDRAGFLIVCDEELQRLKELEEQET